MAFGLTCSSSEQAPATRARKQDSRTRRLPSGLPFCLRSACRAQDTHALRSHALLLRFRCAPLRDADSCPHSKSGSPSAEPFQSPREWVATAHPLGKHVPQTADKPEETEPNTMFNKVILIGRLGQNAEAKTAQNKNEYVILNIATQESWRATRATARTAPSGTASMPGGICRSSPRLSRRVNSSLWKGFSGIAR